MSFKVGDKVIRLDGENRGCFQGNIGEVIVVDEYGYNISVLTETGHVSINNHPDFLELVKAEQVIDTSGKYVRAVYELVDLSIKDENFTLDMGEIKELIKELQELV